MKKKKNKKKKKKKKKNKKKKKKKWIFWSSTTSKYHVVANEEYAYYFTSITLRTVLKLPTSLYIIDIFSFHITDTAEINLFLVFQGLIHFWYILTFNRQNAKCLCSNILFPQSVHVQASHKTMLLCDIPQHPRISLLKSCFTRQVLAY